MAGDDRQGATTLGAVFQVDIEHPFKQPALRVGAARGAGCVVRASTACGACGQSEEGLPLHQTGDVETVARQLETLASRLKQVSAHSRKGKILSKSLTWEQVGRHLASTSKDLLENKSKRLAGFGI